MYSCTESVNDFFQLVNAAHFHDTLVITRAANVWSKTSECPNQDGTGDTKKCWEMMGVSAAGVQPRAHASCLSIEVWFALTVPSCQGLTVLPAARGFTRSKMARWWRSVEVVLLKISGVEVGVGWSGFPWFPHPTICVNSGRFGTSVRCSVVLVSSRATPDGLVSTTA